MFKLDQFDGLIELFEIVKNNVMGIGERANLGSHHKAIPMPITAHNLVHAISKLNRDIVSVA